MHWLRSIVREVLGLFVDDGWLALAIVVWLAIVWWLRRFAATAAVWPAVILFLGLATILVAGVLWRARRH